ncbi:methionine-tRNA ligase [Rhinocladiella mackenziei CBS 650.93]|uniref:Probable methionine--tRNA ligase, mitochondrial n=1 Tax=Rhinocladiella mackenziei CBS 650.93 TaxID=1442369 RepID=A0A0D2FDH7_9EURO|nr:methionine-tRNA ligase [Rhinocladiella mackenziei CBS 650.93]KIX00137.1 methionine-tRNA ligase [Rhinocladiella mackenziei CBS 650.93]
MIALEQRARSFFLRCRASARYSSPRLAQCRRCLPRRGLATAIETEQPAAKPVPEKPYYVTSPIFYVNSGRCSPHVGHLYTLVLSDILKRWAKLRGDERATLLTGTDEHGMKIQKAAQTANTNAKLFCDQHAQQFKSLCQAANINYDRFIRTTDDDHRIAVEHFWNELNHAGYIYEAKHEGWYSISDETFYPESQVQKVLDPSTGETKIASIETGKEVEWTSETNYHFKLSAFQQPLLKHYSENPGAIVPKQRMAFIMKEIESGLNDLSVSRPSTRLSWGVRVPGDSSQTIYVWLDALINYLTMTGYPFTDRNDPTNIWPPNCQVIGKDIIRFHTIYWPAFLMALDQPLPRRFLTHAHWTMNNEKMSKSAGNGVNPFMAMDRYGVDSIRFYMAYHGGIVDDAMYENSQVAETYKHILRDGFGNLLHRVFKSKHFNVHDAVRFVAENQGLRDLYEQLALVRIRTDASMREPDPRTTIHLITELIRNTNKFFHNAALWKRFQTEDPEELRLARYSLFMSAESIRIIAILLQPFMPERMKVALDMMEVHESRRTFEHTRVGADFIYGPPTFEADTKASTEVIFPMLLSAN